MKHEIEENIASPESVELALTVGAKALDIRPTSTGSYSHAPQTVAASLKSLGIGANVDWDEPRVVNCRRIEKMTVTSSPICYKEHSK
ncbi:hypothetical protein PM082_008940 [Marasmius tenuissimus]|nr:hypothetical protein PM082_008940 [Marasmius tenuissimus]